MYATKPNSILTNNSISRSRPNNFECSSCFLWCKKRNSTIYSVLGYTLQQSPSTYAGPHSKVYSSKVTKLITAIRSRELMIMTPLATSGRWQQGTGWLFGLQMSGAR